MFLVSNGMEVMIKMIRKIFIERRLYMNKICAYMLSFTIWK